MSNMRICFVCNDYPPYPHGGIGSRTSVLATEMARQGHQITVFGIPPANRGITQDREDNIDGVRVVRLTFAPRSLGWKLRELRARFKLTRWLRAAARTKNFDIIDGVDAHGWLLFGAVTNRPLAVNFAATAKLYNHVLHRRGLPFIHWLEARAMRHATHLYAPSQWAADKTREVFGYLDKPCKVIYNAVDTDLFSPDLNIPVEPGLVVFANGIEPRKGVEQLLQSFNIWGKKHPDTRLVIIGNDSQPLINGQTYTEHCLDMVEPELRNRITFTGQLDRNKGVLDYLRRAEICVYPSLIETFGIAQMEAMSVGKPVIYSTTGPGPEIIKHGETGLLCDPYSPDSIADCMEQLLSNPAFRQNFGQNARREVLNRFNHRNWAKQQEEFFQECIEDFKRSGGRRMGTPER